MFGYIRPQKGQLRVWEYELFRASYCGLCHTLGRRYGPVWRLLLNYDFCYLAILLSGAERAPCRFCRRRCIVSPLRRRQVLVQTAALEYAADATVLLTWHKVCDGIRDETGLRRFGLRVLCALMGRGYRRAAAFRPALAQAIGANVDALTALEEAQNPSLDRAADTFAQILAAAAADLPDAGTARPLRELLYHTGRWIYIADAWNDTADDIRTGSYNPIVLRDALREPPKGEGADSLYETMEFSCAAASRAFDLMDLGDFGGIVGNVLYLGMPGVAGQIRSGTYRPFSLCRKGVRHGSL